MKTQTKLFLIKASPSPDGVGKVILNDIKNYISQELNCKIEIFDQANENCNPAYWRSSVNQFIEADQHDETIFEKNIMESDGIVIFTPVYLRQMPGEFKLTLDSFSYRMHEFPLIGKKMIIFTYCMSNGADDLANYMKTIFTSAGAEITAHQMCFQSYHSIDGSIKELKDNIKSMCMKIENNLYSITKTQEQLFQYYKSIVMEEIAKGVVSNKQKRWLELMDYDSLCNYLEVTRT